MYSLNRVRGIFTLVLATTIGCTGGAYPSNEQAETVAHVEQQASGGPVYSCDLRQQDHGYCQEYAKTGTGVAERYQEACTESGGVWSDTTCSRSNAIGGCKGAASDIVTITNWFYIDGPYGEDADTFAQSCSSGEDSGVYITPY